MKEIEVFKICANISGLGKEEADRALCFLSSLLVVLLFYVVFVSCLL
jgi:hypothetical protein